MRRLTLACLLLACQALSAPVPKPKAPPPLRPPAVKLKSAMPSGEAVVLTFEVSNPNREKMMHLIGLQLDDPAVVYWVQRRKGKEWAAPESRWAGYEDTAIGGIAAEGKKRFSAQVAAAGWDEVKVGVAWSPGLGRPVLVAWSDPVTPAKAGLGRR